MDIEKLIEQLRSYTYWLGQDGPESHDIHPIICDDAATALSTIQGENEKLRAEVESLKKGYCAGCSIPAVKAEQIRDLTDAPKLRAELERVKRERDAAVERIREWEKFDTYLVVHNFITPEKWRGPGKEN